MSSIIRLDILTLPSSGNYVEFQSGETPGMKETFVPLRTVFGQCTIGNWPGGTLQDKLNNQLGGLVGSLQADYSTNLEVRLDLNVPPGVLPHITVESNIYNYFTSAKWIDIGSNFTATFTNVPTVEPITVDSIVFSEASIPCTSVNTVITTS